MRPISEIIIILLLIIMPVIAQNYDNDPLEDGYIIHNGGGQEIVSSTNTSVSIFKYFKEMEMAPWDTVVSVLRYDHGVSEGFPDMVTADLDGDSLNEIVKVWIENDGIEIAVLKPDPNLLSIDGLAEWQKIVRLQKKDPLLYHAHMGINLPEVVLVQCGNLDADPQREFVVAYWADDGTGNGFVNLTVYDVDDTLGVFEKGSIMDQPIENPPKVELCEDAMYLFDIECGDFNGDGTDEILLGGREPASPSGWQFFTKIYTYEPESGNLVAKVKETIYTQVDSLYDVANLNLAAGHLATTNKDQAVVGFYQYNQYRPDADTVSFTIIPIEANDLLTEISVGPLVVQKKDTLDAGCMIFRESTMKVKDINNDGQDEIISAFSVFYYAPPRPIAMKTFKIYQMQSELNLSVWADLDTITDSYHANIAVGNICRELDEDVTYSEFIIDSYIDGSMYQLRYNEDGTFQQVVLLIEDIPDLRFYGTTEPMGIGEFDGDIRLGSPNRFSATEILQPLVILNAPPIHFDVFNDQIYDLCSSYNENDPQFIASYLKESSPTPSKTAGFQVRVGAVIHTFPNTKWEIFFLTANILYFQIIPC